MSVLIDPREVDKTIRECLYTEEELNASEKDEKGIPKGAVLVRGIMHNMGFHPGRLEAARPKVKTWLMALPDQFRKSSGGGWSFLNACMDRNNEQWGEHMDMDRLFTMGIGLNLVTFMLPRDMWNILPGGMPYIVVLDDLCQP